VRDWQTGAATAGALEKIRRCCSSRVCLVVRRKERRAEAVLLLVARLVAFIL